MRGVPHLRPNKKIGLFTVTYVLNQGYLHFFSQFKKKKKYPTNRPTVQNEYGLKPIDRISADFG